MLAFGIGLLAVIWIILLFFCPVYVLTDDETTIKQQTAAMICLGVFYVSIVAMICIFV